MSELKKAAAFPCLHLRRGVCRQPRSSICVFGAEAVFWLRTLRFSPIFPIPPPAPAIFSRALIPRKGLMFRVRGAILYAEMTYRRGAPGGHTNEREEPIMFCSQCGNQVEDTANFCSRCGSRLTRPQGGVASFPQGAAVPFPQGAGVNPFSRGAGISPFNTPVPNPMFRNKKDDIHTALSDYLRRAPTLAGQTLSFGPLENYEEGQDGKIYCELVVTTHNALGQSSKIRFGAVVKEVEADGNVVFQVPGPQRITALYPAATCKLMMGFRSR